jgi:hypothetical protein
VLFSGEVAKLFGNPSHPVSGNVKMPIVLNVVSQAKHRLLAFGVTVAKNVGLGEQRHVIDELCFATRHNISFVS